MSKVLSTYNIYLYDKNNNYVGEICTDFKADMEKDQLIADSYLEIPNIDNIPIHIDATILREAAKGWEKVKCEAEKLRVANPIHLLYPGCMFTHCKYDYVVAKDGCNNLRAYRINDMSVSYPLTSSEWNNTVITHRPL